MSVSNTKESNVWKISLWSMDSHLLDSFVQKIGEMVRKTSNVIFKTCPMKTRRKLITVNSSPTIYKKTRDQFICEAKKRVVYLTFLGPEVADIWNSISLPEGIELEIKRVLDSDNKKKNISDEEKAALLAKKKVK